MEEAATYNDILSAYVNQLPDWAKKIMKSAQLEGKKLTIFQATARQMNLRKDFRNFVKDNDLEVVVVTKFKDKTTKYMRSWTVLLQDDDIAQLNHHAKKRNLSGNQLGRAIILSWLQNPKFTDTTSHA